MWLKYKTWTRERGNLERERADNEMDFKAASARKFNRICNFISAITKGKEHETRVRGNAC